MNKKIVIILVLFFLVIAGGLVILTRPDNLKSEDKVTETESLDTIRIAHIPSHLSTTFPLFVAQEKGFFKENGLNIEFINLSSPAAVPALINNEVDYIPFLEATTRASLKGAPIKSVFFFLENFPYGLVSQPELKIEDINDIRVGRLHSLFHYAALEIINQKNINAKISSGGDGLLGVTAALEAKQAQAGLVGIENALQLREKGFNLLDTYVHQISAQGLATTDAKINENPDEVVRVINSVRKAIAFMKNNPEETKILLSRFLNIDRETNIDLINELYEVAVKTFIESGIPSDEAINSLIRLSKTERFDNLEEIKNQEVTPEDINSSIDFRFLR